MEPATLRIFAAAIFVLTYILIIKFYKKKVWVIWSGVALMLLVGATSFQSGFNSINWNVIGIYVGMLLIAEALVESKLPDAVAVWVANRANKAGVVMLLLCLITSILSIVLENVACVLLVAPIVFSISKKLHISPVPTIIGCAVSSNLQGVATLIGDPPSMLLAGHAHLTFNDFFMFEGKPSLFFAVQLGMLASLAVLYFFFRKYNAPIKKFKPVKVKSYVPLIALILMIVGLASYSFRNGDSHYMLGGICMVFGIACLLWLLRMKKNNKKSVWSAVWRMDWGTAMFIIAVFVMVDGLAQTNVIGTIANFIGSIVGSNLLGSFVTIVILSMLISAFVDNVPYLVAMLPVIDILATQMAVSPFVLFFGLLIGASVGGNITPIGAAANIVGTGLLKNRGYETSFWEFIKIGLPFTIVATAVSAGFIWLMFGI